MWISFDRQDEGISSLYAFRDSLKALGDDPRYFKYCIISIHNALQAYVCIAFTARQQFQSLEETGSGTMAPKIQR